MTNLNIGQLVSFKVGNEMFATTISRVQEIIRIPNIVEVPKSPDFVKGVINLRGRVIPVVDLQTKFEVNVKTDKKDRRIIIAEINSVIVGLVVDSVSEVLQVNEEHYSKTPEIVSSAHQKFIEGVINNNDDEDMIMILALDSILSSEESDILKTVK